MASVASVWMAGGGVCARAALSVGVEDGVAGGTLGMSWVVVFVFTSIIKRKNKMKERK